MTLAISGGALFGSHAIAGVASTNKFGGRQQSLAPARGGVAVLGGLKLDYWDTGGKGEPIVLLHPATGSCDIWAFQKSALVGSGYRVIAYSRRGFGRSDAGAADSPGSAAGDLEALMSWLDLERVHLLGSAAGAFVAIDFAVSFPSRLYSLILANSLGGIDEPSWTQDNERILPKNFRDLPVDFRELSAGYRFANPNGAAIWLKLASEASPGLRVLQKPRSKVDFAALSSIVAPTLVMTGDADLYMPPARARALASRIPHATVAVIEEAGYSAYWEQPAAFNARVLAFLKAHSAA